MQLSNINRKQNFFMISVLFLIYGIDNYCREKELSIDFFGTVKNGWLVLVIAFLFYEMCRMQFFKKGSHLIFVKEFKGIIILTVSFAVLSLFYILKNGALLSVTIGGLFRLVLPVFAAFVLLNLMGENEIYKLMEILFIIMLGCYLLANIDNFTISNFREIDFINSHSPFESHFFSPPAMALCLFFCYYRKKPGLTLLSVIFTVMTFKRVMVVYAVFIFFAGEIVKRWKSVSECIIRIFMVCFTLFSLFYIQLMSGAIEDLIMKYWGQSVNVFTMGRSWFMRNLMENFVSYGFMSSTAAYRSIEMDIPMVYLEMGFLAVIATVYFITKLAGNNWYNFLICIFLLLELLTSHWFDITYFWILIYITIGTIAYKSEPSTPISSGKRIKFVISKQRNMFEK